MDKHKLKRYELAVYLLLILLSAVLAFIGHYLIYQETIQSIFINLASELLAVGVLFFIVNRIFLLDGINENNDSIEILNVVNTTKNSIIQHEGETQKQRDRVEQALGLLVSRVEKVNDSSKENSKIIEQALSFLVTRVERVGDSSEENSKILEAIRSESALADKVQERIQINDRLSSLSEQLKGTEVLLNEKDQERMQTSKKLNEEFKVISKQLKNLETTLTKTFDDMGKQLKAKQRLIVKDLSETVNSNETKEHISAEVKRNLPVPIYPDISIQPEDSEAVSKALTNEIIDTYSQELSGTLDGLKKDLSASYDEAAYNRVKKLLHEIDRIKQQLQELKQETQE